MATQLNILIYLRLAADHLHWSSCALNDSLKGTSTNVVEGFIFLPLILSVPRGVEDL